MLVPSTDVMVCFVSLISLVTSSVALDAASAVFERPQIEDVVNHGLRHLGESLPRQFPLRVELHRRHFDLVFNGNGTRGEGFGLPWLKASLTEHTAIISRCL